MAATLRSYLEGIKDPKEIQEILREHSWANPPSTNEYHFRSYDPKTNLVHGNLIEEDGDLKLCEPKRLEEVFGYLAIDTLERHPADRRGDGLTRAIPVDW